MHIDPRWTKHRLLKNRNLEWNIDVPDKTVDTDLAEFGKVTLPDCLDPSCPLIEKKNPNDMNCHWKIFKYLLK